MPAWWASIAPFVTFVAGFCAKWLEEWVQDKRLSRREQEKLKAARRDFLHQRRADFQRENLLALQTASQKLVRLTSRVQLVDLADYRKSGVWGKAMLPEELDQELLIAQTETALLGVRILDQEARDLSMALKSKCTAVSLCSDEQQSKRLLNTAGDVFVSLNARIGEVLRTLDAEDEGN